MAFQSNISVADAAVEVGSKYGSMFDDEVSPEPIQQASEVKSENISSKGSEFAKKLTNPGNNLKVTYKGREFRNAEHAYQTYKSGEFDQKAYDSNAFKPVGSKPANRNTNYQTMVDILKAKLEQHPELIEGINERGGLSYIEESTHNVTGDKFWESKGQNKFIEALADAYQAAQPTQQTSDVIPKEKIPQYKMEDVFEFGKQLPVEKFGTSKLRKTLEDLVDKPYIENFENIISVLKEYNIPVNKKLNEALLVLKESGDEFRKVNLEIPQNKKEADRWVELLGYKNSFIKYVADAIATKYKIKPLKIGIANNDLLIPTQQTIEVTDDTSLEGGLSFQDDIDDAIADMNDEHFREVIEQEMSLFEPENWNEVEAWMKKNLPNVPLNRVQNFIRAGEGKLAYGVFKDNAIYVYENAEVGTTYHEAFEAVFNSILSPEERSKLRAEFNSRKGTFVDRPTGQTVKFSEATGQQAKEQLAEEFRDYIRDNIKPKGTFARIFKQLKELIEKLFLSPNSDNLAKELFKKIDTGFYSDATFEVPAGTYRDAFVIEPEYRLVVTNLSDRQIYDTVQEMTFQLVSEALKEDKNLFNLSELTKDSNKTYQRLRTRILQVVKQKENVATRYINASQIAKSKGQKEFDWTVIVTGKHLYI